MNLVCRFICIDLYLLFRGNRFLLLLMTLHCTEICVASGIVSLVKVLTQLRYKPEIVVMQKVMQSRSFLDTTVT